MSPGFRVAATAFGLLAVLLAAGCNTLSIGEDGLGRIPGTDSLVLRPESIAGVGRYAVLGAADTMFLGRDAEYVSRVLISFALPDSALDSITRAQLILHPADSTRMAFICHPCTVDWRSNAATWWVADSTTQWLQPGGDFDSTVTVGLDTLRGDSLVMEISPALMPKLVRESFGIILLPLDTGFARLVSGFTFATAPRFKLYWGREQKTSSVFNAFEDTHIVDTLGIGAGPGYRAVGSGFGFRTYLKFDLDTIPPEATIARAELRFRPELEYRRTDTLRLGVRRLLEPFGTRGGNPRYAESPSARLEYMVGPDSVPDVVIDLQRLVQYWMNVPRDEQGRDTSNFGLFLVAEPEWADFFRFRVPSTGPDAPRLELLYALPPTGRLR